MMTLNCEVTLPAERWTEIAQVLVHGSGGALRDTYTSYELGRKIQYLIRDKEGVVTLTNGVYETNLIRLAEGIVVEESRE